MSLFNWFISVYILFSFVFFCPALAETNKSFIKTSELEKSMNDFYESKDIKKAREDIFNNENTKYKIDSSQFKEFFVDKKYSPNQKFRNADFCTNGHYRIYKGNKSFIYDKNGRLLFYILQKIYLSKENYNIYIDYFYDIYGNLAYISHNSKKNRGEYFFNANKELIYIGSKLHCYDKYGNLLFKSRPFFPYK